MRDNQVEILATTVVERLQAARNALLAQMQALGLTPAKGWRVTEELRHTTEGTEWVFRPMHIREPVPDLRSVVIIDHDGRPVSSS
jgi:hypothetical protein